MFVSEEKLELPNKDLFTANEFVRMKVVWEKDNTYERFVKANEWVKSFLPNWQPNESAKCKVQSASWRTKLKVKSLFGFKLYTWFCTFISALCTNTIESIARTAQLKYMERRKTTELVTNGLLMFHPNDAREWVMKEYKKRLRELETRN